MFVAALLLLVSWIGFIDALSSSSQIRAPTTQVKVSIQRHVPALSTPVEARREFLDYVWEHGGGLPILIRPKTTREKTDGLETTLQRRQLLPILMEEELLETTPEIGDSSIRCQLQYQVKHGGLLSSEIVPDSHLGTVTFATDTSQDGGITLTWDVTFDTREASRTFLWQFITEQTIRDSCNNFQAAYATPRIYQRTTMLSHSKYLPELTPEIAMDQWLQFCWKEGSGSPLPIPPVQMGSDVRWIIPPFLKERLVSTNTVKSQNGKADYAEVRYQVDNPSLFTYQVHSHRGRVRFVSIDDDTADTSNLVRME